MRTTKIPKISAFSLVFVLLGVLSYADGYYVRMVYESVRDNVSLRYEEVYEQGDTKIVFVAAKDTFTWLKVGDRYYVGSGKTLYRTFPIKDLEDFAREYLKARRVELKDGIYKFNEPNFSLEIVVLNSEILKISRKVGDVVTTMHISRFSKNFDIREIISKYQIVDKSPVPEELFRIFNLFLWATVQEERLDVLKIVGYDRDGKLVELEINKTGGDFKINNYYLKVIKATEKTVRDIRDALRGN